MAAAALVKICWVARVFLKILPRDLGFYYLKQVSLVKRHLLKDLEQKKVATPNQTNCNTESPAALEEAKVSPTLPTT